MLDILCAYTLFNGDKVWNIYKHDVCFRYGLSAWNLRGIAYDVRHYISSFVVVVSGCVVPAVRGDVESLRGILITLLARDMFNHSVNREMCLPGVVGIYDSPFQFVASIRR